MKLPLSPLPLFLRLPSEPLIAWSRWHELFETFVAAMGLVDTPSARWRAMLIHSLGSKGQHIFRTLGPVEAYADCVALIAGHFTTPQSIVPQCINPVETVAQPWGRGASAAVN